MSNEITRMMTLSTGHITEKTAEMLAEEPAMNAMQLSVYPKSDFGWFIYITGEAGPDVPDDLKAVMKRARAAGCGVLCLDSDGPEVDGLETYDW